MLSVGFMSNLRSRSKQRPPAGSVTEENATCQVDGVKEGEPNETKNIPGLLEVPSLGISANSGLALSANHRQNAKIILRRSLRLFASASQTQVSAPRQLSGSRMKKKVSFN